MKLWEKKYQLNEQIENYTVGDDYMLDQKLVKYDCQASIAHAKMLKKIGILTNEECDILSRILNEIIKINDNGLFIIRQHDEDCHTAIENYLVKKLGSIGKKIHTARSRNDQVITALRLYYKDEIKCIIQSIDSFIEILGKFKEKYSQIEMPGYTHMRKAMPSSVGSWADAFIESMEDNKLLLFQTFDLVDQSPLGTGAGYGLPIKLDRNLTTKLLGFKKTQKNPIYVQNSRGKFESAILHTLSQIMVDLNKMASDIILFSMSEFDYFKLTSEICTGSSIMPHKKNPDVLEIIRARYHQIVSYEFEVKGIIGSLVSGYNRDIQLTKKPVISGFEITKESLNIMGIVIKNLHVNKEKCKKALTEELYATKRVYALVEKSIPFRDAYVKIAKEYTEK